MRLEIESKIKKIIEKSGVGTIHFAEDFIASGNSASINRALSRLAQKKIIIRLSHGIYLYPKIDENLGVLYPSIEEIARTIADRDRARIIPTGDLALNRLGLSTQIPLNFVYLTDGSPRTIKVGKKSIKFKKTAPKNLSAKGDITGLVIQALKKIGKGNISAVEKKIIQDALEKEKPELLNSDLKLAPAWMREMIFDFIHR
ncbi:MAG: DUF6088 family protein [Candidatus Delongbacteria bacterium]|jgi:hypothetical protein|nr:DUF6088 family protein [Candidatus Delongbacteria bacterium]MDD4206183.1 DUF6088 family protein [Candidatus Delongbacteria bacterium]